MRVCIYGLGAIGGLLGARLARGGAEVSAVARGQTLKSVVQDGLVLVEGQLRSTFKIEATEDPSMLGPQDLVILSVKQPALGAVASRIGPLLGADTDILSAMNGIPWWFFHGLPGREPRLEPPSLDPTGSLASNIPLRSLVGSAFHLSSSCPSPGVVHHGSGERIILGDPHGVPNSTRVNVIADVLRGGGFEVILSERIQADIWLKLWGNMTMNPISGITGATLDRILADDLVRGFATKCMDEASRIGALIGLPISVTAESRHSVTEELGTARTSMLQDVELGRPVELDAMVTIVSELGDLLDVDTPFIDVLLGMARLHARVRGLYPESVQLNMP